jgi:catechol 1,2-dioxygenase
MGKLTADTHSDVQFGVTRALIGDFVRHEAANAEFGFAGPWYSLDQVLRVEPGEACRPRPPIQAQAAGAALTGAMPAAGGNA